LSEFHQAGLIGHGQVLLEPGSCHGSAARLVTTGGKNAQQGSFEVVGSLDDGNESRGKTVFQRTGLPQLCCGLGGGKVLAFIDAAEAQRQFLAEFRIFGGGFLHAVNRAVQIRAREQCHQNLRVDLHVINTAGMILADPCDPRNLSDEELLSDARAHGAGKNAGFFDPEGFEQSCCIVGYLRNGGVVFLRVGGQPDAAVIERDQLVLLSQFFDHERIPQAQGGKKPINHQQGFAFTPGVGSQLHAADLGVFDFCFEHGMQR